VLRDNLQEWTGDGNFGVKIADLGFSKQLQDAGEEM
jgi:hypothetical protein